MATKQHIPPRLSASSALVLTALTLGVAPGCLQPRHPASPAENKAPVAQQAAPLALPPLAEVVWPGAGFPGCPECQRPKHVGQQTLDLELRRFYQLYKENLYKKFPAGSPLGKVGGMYVAGGAAGHIYGWADTEAQCGTSEGHGWGMMFAVMMADAQVPGLAEKAIFDGLNAARKALDAKNHADLMSWVVPCSGRLDLQKQGSATDGDVDSAYALLLADEKWPGNGYKQDALAVIQAARAQFIYEKKPNDKFFPRFNTGSNDNDKSHPGGKGCVGSFFDSSGKVHPCSSVTEGWSFMTRPSDFQVTAWRAFHSASGDKMWEALIAPSQRILEAVRDPKSGLIPDFVADDEKGMPRPSKTGAGDEGVVYNAWSWNACRVPMRQAASVACYGDAGGKLLNKTTVAWAMKTAHGGNGIYLPKRIRGGGYALDGVTPVDKDEYDDPAFSSPLVAAAISGGPEAQPFLDFGWKYMKGWKPNDDDPKTTGGVWEDGYYPASVNLFSMLVASGRFGCPKDAAPTK